MSFAAMLPRALIAWLGSDRSYRQREPAALVLTAAAGAGRGQLGVRQALLPSPRLPSIPGTSNQPMRVHRAAHSSLNWSLRRSGDAGAAMRRLVAEREISFKPESVCTDASPDDRGGSSAHRTHKVARQHRIYSGSAAPGPGSVSAGCVIALDGTTTSLEGRFAQRVSLPVRR